MDLDPLFARLEQLAPSFGRAEGDLQALVARGRAGDFKGAMQNARLVLEVLLRHLVTTELKQTPGKAMVDELLAKFRQAANAHVIPTPVLAHMGTVQAWGNLSSHDHAASLNDAAMTLGPEEMGTALNSLVAVLAWYAGKYGAPAPRPGTPAPASNAPPRRGGVLPWALGAAAVAALAAGAWALQGRPGEPAAAPGPPAPTASGRAALAAAYARWKEPEPPAGCRVQDPSRAARLLDTPAALAAEPGPRAPELAFLVARARADLGQSADEALREALACPGFAAARALAGKLAAKADRADDAAAHFEGALAEAPDFARARFNLAVVELKRSRVAQGVAHLEAYVKLEPQDADGWFMLGVAREAQARAEATRGEDAQATTAAARDAFCSAHARGKTEAKDRCQGP